MKILKVKDVEFVKKYNGDFERFCIKEYPKITAITILDWGLNRSYIVNHYDSILNNIHKEYVGPTHMVFYNINKFEYLVINNDNIIFCDTYDDVEKLLELIK